MTLKKLQGQVTFVQLSQSEPNLHPNLVREATAQNAADCAALKKQSTSHLVKLCKKKSFYNLAKIKLTFPESYPLTFNLYPKLPFILNSSIIKCMRH